MWTGRLLGRTCAGDSAALTPARGPPASGGSQSPPATAAARRHYALAAGALVLLALIWGYTWPLMKSVLTYADPFLYAGMRTFMGGVLLVACCRCSAGRCGPRPSG